MQTAHELFIHELGDMFDAEQRILEALQELEQETQRTDIKKAFSLHRAQTKKQVERLRKCFESLDEQPREQECRGMRGILDEKEALEREDPTEELRDLFNLGGAGKVEHYEIAAYNALIDMAQKMGHRQAVRLLQQNLREEQQMLRKCEGLMKKFKPSRMRAGEVEEPGGRRRPRRAA